MTGFEKRSLGRTSLEVTTLGLGCATLGGTRVRVSRREAQAIVRAAWAAGIRYVDTAPYYGFGQAERCVGDALRAAPRDEWVLSTKVGRLLRPRPNPAADELTRHPMPFDAVFDYSYDAIMRSFEDSLQRLGLARIDVLYVHDIGAMQHGQEAHAAIMRLFRDGGYRALEELRRCGAVRAIGIGVNEREVLLEAMEWGAWDAFLLAGRYTLLEQAPLDDLLPKCVRSGVSIVVGGPLNSGILAGRDTWNYKIAPPDIVARVDAIKAICDSHQVPLAAAALQFPLAHPAVAAIIPGPRSVAEFEANLRLLRYPVPSALWRDLRDAKLLHPDAPTPA
ncbi:MAG TPA: aldo/keto reductase [Stellaceae bacterium]|nr:aldo/keto reductase [Stellaceae bacterium]HMD63151.1 aldo/keto reductase [Stellaceae bacterium]